jgi:hypothetical protein
MFKIAPNPTFTADVPIPVPGGSTAKLKLVFKHKTREEIREYFARVGGGTDTDAAESDADVLLEILAGWEDVDADFSRDALNLLLENYPAAPRAIFDTYLAELTGQRRGN